MQNKVNQYAQVELKSDLIKQLSDNDKQALSVFF